MDPITNSQEIILPKHQNVRFNTDTWTNTLATTNTCNNLSLFNLVVTMSPDRVKEVENELQERTSQIKFGLTMTQASQNAMKKQQFENKFENKRS